MGRLKPPQDSTYMMIIKQPIFVTHFICLICTHLLSKSFGRLLLIITRLLGEEKKPFTNIVEVALFHIIKILEK